MRKSDLRPVRSYWIVLFFGTLCGLIFWLFYGFGLIRIYGYKQTRKEISRGNHIIMANHPTLKDPFILLSMWWPLMLFRRRKFLPWSTPDVTYFAGLARWAYPVIHSIPVDRINKNGAQVVRGISLILKEGWSLIIHPEEGRTLSPRRDGVVTPDKFHFSQDGSRKIRWLTNAAALRTAIKNGSRVTPTFIAMPNYERVPGFELWGWKRASVYYGQAYLPDPNLNDEELLLDLANRILEAGK